MTASTRLNARTRARDMAALHTDVVDVLVVGGGVTGAGVALDAASRGLSVALVDKSDLAAGTSRWSSKLAHGGLRYLAAGQVAVAWESVVERNRIVRTIAPHLVRPMPFLLPVPMDRPWTDRAAARVALALVDAMRAAARTPSALPPSTWISPAHARALVPSLRPDLRGAFVHVDGALEDDLRLVVALARTAAGLGARVVTHCAAVEVRRDGARLVDALSGEAFDVRARTVVVAAGVWSGGLVADVPLQPSKGAHLLVRAEALDHPTAAFNILVPGTRNRYVFAVPRPDGTVQVGLTDDAVDEVVDEPHVSEEDERFLLETLSSGLARPVSAADVVGRFAGLRPLLGQATGTSAADLSRRHALLDRDGVLVLVGGKLTTYRRMAQDAVDAVVRRSATGRPCVTAALPLVGATGAWDATLPQRLLRRFGAEAAAVADRGPAEPVAPGVAALKCEVGWAVSAEGAVTAEDVERRLRLDLVPVWRDAARPYVDEVLASC